MAAPSEAPHHQPMPAVAALLVNALIWGVSWWPFRHLEAQGMHSLWATAWIYAFSAAVILARHPGALRGTAGKPWLLALALASGITNACFNWGVTIGEVVRVVLLFYLMPVWAVLLARWLLDEPITAAALARVALAIGGAAVVLWRPDAALPLPRSLPDWLGVAGGAGFALTNVLLRRRAGDPPQERAFAMFAGGILVPAVLAVALSAGGAAAVHWPAIDPGLALMATATGAAFLVSNLALQYGAARLPANVTAVVMLAEVLFAAVSAAWIGGEALDRRTLAGGALIVVASALAAWSPAAPRPAAAS